MLRHTDTETEKIDKLLRINEALMSSIDQRSSISAYSLFQTATALEQEVQDRTQDLQTALGDLSTKNRELAQAQNLSEASRRNLESAIEAMQEGFALFSEGTLVICNRRFRHLFDDVADAIVPGIRFDDYASAISRSQFLDLGEMNAENWLKFRMDQSRLPQSTFTIALKNDRWLQVSQRQTQDDGMAILHTDVTDMVRHQRREQEKIIDAQANLARVTFENLIQGLATFNADGDLVSCNNRFRVLVPLPYALTRAGVSLNSIVDYLVGQSAFRSAPEADMDWETGLRKRVPMTGELIRHDGAIMDVSFQQLPENGFIATFTDVTAEREVTRALKLAKDTLEARVTERTRALTRANLDLTREIRERQAFEEALREAKEAAETANLSKNRFLRAASHDLLQPMSAAKLFLSTLRSTDLTDPQRDISDRIAGAFASMEELLHALLDISRLESGKEEFNWANVPLSRILEPLRDEFHELAGGYARSLHIVPSSTVVRSDPTYLRRIAQNLVSNAIKYSGQGRVLVGVRHQDNRALLEVWDTGPGILPQDQERIFGEFQRLNETSALPGMGLGLSIVQRACAQLGHKLELESVPGRGSVFRIYMDVVTADAIRAEVPAAEVPTDPLSNIIALVVENDAEMRVAMTVQLENWGMGVLDVSGSQSAVDLIREVDVLPDLIIADYQLDNNDTGLDAIRMVRDQTPHDIPALLVTADRSKAVHQAAAALNIPVMAKPVDPQKLQDAIRALTGRKA